MALRGIRGATVAPANRAEDILDATRELLMAMVEGNPSINKQDVASVIFTVTNDLDAAFPAAAAREMGWDDAALMCAREIPVPGDLERGIRVLIHWNTDLPQSEIHHVYLKQAVRLRPDLKIEKTK